MILREKVMDGSESDADAHTDEETERRARNAIRRSFEMPHRPQKEMVGKTGRPSRRKRASSKTTKQPQ
jgi:hypothetical protein